jgi:hypothetical protein
MNCLCDRTCRFDYNEAGSGQPPQNNLSSAVVVAINVILTKAVVILSGVRISRREVLTESKDPGVLNMSMSLERHPDDDSTVRIPCEAAGKVEVAGVPSASLGQASRLR